MLDNVGRKERFAGARSPVKPQNWGISLYPALEFWFFKDPITCAGESLVGYVVIYFLRVATRLQMCHDYFKLGRSVVIFLYILWFWIRTH